MRIISGQWKGRNLKTVKGMNTRPTSDKVKGAIFNILAGKVMNARVLDLFAGTGNLSFEALSRGGRHAVLVEKDTSALETIRKNAEILGAVPRTSILRMDAMNFFKQAVQERFDLIFLDPPYRQGLADMALAYLQTQPLLNPGGVIIIETSSDETVDDAIDPLEIRLIREYGDTRLWFIQNKEEHEEG
ncbi:MAG: 16S rRNA (guanine(966)-N(2))-methyltransferase RsmD [Dehalobacter sp.]|nr:16S rRNA (guanine(966)-N(2))-methyltransferase RsmD [Dehalobacter sp.]